MSVTIRTLVVAALGLPVTGVVPGMALSANADRLLCRAASPCITARPGCTSADTGWFVAPALIADLPGGVSSDGRGAYVRGKDGVGAIVVGSTTVVTMYDTSASARSITVDLTKPVSGGGSVPLGIVNTHNGRGRATQWYLVTQLRRAGDSLPNLSRIAVGRTVAAAMMVVGFAVEGRAHILQMGPQPAGHCDVSQTLVHGTGTSSGTAYRATASKWVMDLPEGSVGRLFDIQDGLEHAVDHGLYYVRLHYEIGQ